MELKCLHAYSAGTFNMVVGETTIGKAYITAGKKTQMLNDFPTWFSDITSTVAGLGTAATTAEGVVTTAEGDVDDAVAAEVVTAAAIVTAEEALAAAKVDAKSKRGKANGSLKV